MNDLAESYRWMRQRSQAKRERNRTQSPKLLVKAGVNFQSKNYGAHLIIESEGCAIDFWPGTGRWMIRNGKTGFGIKNLLKHLGKGVKK